MTQASPEPAPELHIATADRKSIRAYAGHLESAIGEGTAGQRRAFVKIHSGCDQACTFCAIPAEQGPNVSMPVADVVGSIQGLVNTGHLEIVLAGSDIAGYGIDLGTDLSSLIKSILESTPNLLRLRLGTLDPLSLGPDFFDVLASEPRLMGHLHFSLQSGDDEILSAMGRRHRTQDIHTVLAETRNARPGAVIGADIMVGFPGETDAQFENTVNAIADWQLTHINAFPYAFRADVAAASLDAVDAEVIKSRAAKLGYIRNAAKATLLDHLTGGVHGVYMEQENFGWTESFAPVRLVKPVDVGQVVDVAVTAQRDGELLGSAMGDFRTTSGDQAGGWMKKLREGLGKSSARMTTGIGELFVVRRRLDDDVLEQLEDTLITADLGVSTAARLTAGLAKSRFNQEVGDLEVREAFAEEIATILTPAAKPLDINPLNKPHVILVCGVNGSGKTTTIGKLTKQLSESGHSVMLAAGDTFRAAAIEQLQVWGERTGAPVIAREIGSDSAGLAYDALQQARAESVDVLIIDTAGRLQNKTHLMEELEKVVRVLKKIDLASPHDVVLVLDATVGQNAHSQVEAFKKSVNVTGLVMTKLDGTAKGGVVVALADKFKLPVHAIGVGEGVDDLQAFNAKDFARNLMGLET